MRCETRSQAICGTVSSRRQSCSMVGDTVPANTIEKTFWRSRIPLARLSLDGIIWNTFNAAVRLSTSGDVNSMPKMACTSSGLACTRTTTSDRLYSWPFGRKWAARLLHQSRRNTLKASATVLRFGCAIVTATNCWLATSVVSIYC